MSIILRECDWRSSPYAQFPVLPHEGAIENDYDEDQRWQGVASAIDLLVQSRLSARNGDVIPVAPFGRPTGSQSSEVGMGVEELPEAAPLRVSDVFTTVGFPSVTFVVPTAVPQLIYELSVRARVLIVEGPSGIGKSVAAEYALKELRTSGKQAWPQRWLQAKKRETDLVEILSLPKKRIDDIVEASCNRRFPNADASRTAFALMTLPKRSPTVLVTTQRSP